MNVWSGVFKMRCRTSRVPKLWQLCTARSTLFLELSWWGDYARFDTISVQILYASYGSRGLPCPLHLKFTLPVKHKRLKASINDESNPAKSFWQRHSKHTTWPHLRTSPNKTIYFRSDTASFLVNETYTKHFSTNQNWIINNHFHWVKCDSHMPFRVCSEGP